MKLFTYILAIVVSMLLGACGGGGGDSSTSTSSTSQYTGVGATVLNLDWSTHTNPDGSSHQATVNNIITQTATGATLVPVTYTGSPSTSSQWTQTISNTLAGMANGQIINISAGFVDYANKSSIVAPSTVPNILISRSAGNNGLPTLNTDQNQALYNSAYKGGLILVGALGSDGNIASYSATAGAAADRFVIADATCTGTSYSGTSCSAPRVAGYAAIIKQKYPNATGDQIATAILNTAVLKSGWDPAIYGKGQVDLNAALNYLGTAK